MVKHDPINSPSYYSAGRKYETIDVIEDWQLSYRLGNSVKYISRAGRKDPAKTIEDLKKAKWYLEREIAALEGEKSPYAPPSDVQYSDILEDQVYCATNGEELLMEPGAFGHNVFFARDKDWKDFWDYDDEFMWDPSLGPVEISPKEIEEILSRKNLDQFRDDEIVSTVERRGLILGLKKDGSSCILGSKGKCA